MAEITGLVLGGIPIAIWALEKYSEALDTYRNYSVVIRTLRTNLILEERKLQLTFASLGLDKPTRMELEACLVSNFPEIAGHLSSVVQLMEKTMSELLKDLDVDVYGQPQSNRATWEWRRVKKSFGSKRRDKLVDELRKWNADLRMCIEKSEVPVEDESRRVQNLTRRFNPKRCNLVREWMASLHRALSSGVNCVCSCPHEVAVQLDWPAYESDKFKAIQIAMSYQTDQRPELSGSCWRKLHVEPAGAEALAVSGGLLSLFPLASSPSSLSPSAGTQTIVCPKPSMRTRISRTKFFRSFSKHHTSSEDGVTVTGSVPVELTTPRALPRPPTDDEIQSLCVHLRRQCSVWTLSGSLLDPDTECETRNKFLLSHTGRGSPTVTEPLALRSLIARRRLPRQGLGMSAKKMYNIAAAMCWAVLHLSGGSWLNNQWGDQTKILQERTQAGRNILSDHPCISCFLPAPQTPKATLQNTTEREFSHLIPHPAIFRLGLMLIELCLEKNFSEVQDIEGSVGASSSFNSETAASSSPAAVPADYMYKAAIANLEEVRSRAGESYGDAVERCIKFVFRGPEKTRDFDLPNFRREFYEVVVAPVQATYLMMPGAVNEI